MLQGSILGDIHLVAHLLPEQGLESSNQLDPIVFHTKATFTGSLLLFVNTHLPTSSKHPETRVCEGLVAMRAQMAPYKRLY